MAAPTPTQRLSRRRAALVVAALVADFSWVAAHIRALSALGLADGEPAFYAAYQVVRAAIAGAALAIALRAGWFDRSELGLDSARHGPALRWLATVGGGSVLVVTATLALAWLAVPSLVCELAARALGGSTAYPWPTFVRDTLCMVLLAPIYEEILYRALLLSALRERFADPQALALGGGVFMLLHYFYGYGLNTGYILVALVLGWVYLRTGSLVAAIVLHALNNLWFTGSSLTRHTLGDATLLKWLCSE